MLTKKAFRKMFVTSSIVVIILLVYLMPGVIELDNDIKTSAQYVDLVSSKLYLLDNNGLLVETTISIIDDDISNKIKNLINNLSSASNEIIPNGLNSVMPSNIKLLDVYVDENIASLNFSKEFLELEDKELIRLIEAISYTVLNLEEINGVEIYIDKVNISELSNLDIPYHITEEFGINKKYHFKNTDDIVKYVVYYMEEIEDNSYYVPITKYINSSGDKINIIIEDLSSSYIYQPNLISIVDEKLELIDYEISNEELILNFSNSIFMNKDEIREEVVYPMVSTIFSNFDVESVIFQVNGEEILKKTEKNG
ncbi:MAG: GerMN domain-containing protein [Bacilli bacterium]|nr:GerMN domain-containing protein [Bacilli bacterium]